MTPPRDAGARLREVSARHLHLDPTALAPTARLTDDLGLDSLAAIEWGMVIEDELGVLLPEDPWTGVQTYGDVERMVTQAEPAVQP